MESSRAIAIVRHGETNWNLERRIQGRTEVPLNDTGRAQAAATARFLLSDQVRERFGDWAGLLSSPLGRALETAEILAEHMDLQSPGIEHELWERDFGQAEGLSVTDAHARWPGLAIPGAETLEDLAARTANTFTRTLEASPGTILVAHGAMIRAGLSRLSGSNIPRIMNGEVWILTRDSEPRVFKLEQQLLLQR